LAKLTEAQKIGKFLLMDGLAPLLECNPPEIAVVAANEFWRRELLPTFRVYRVSSLPMKTIATWP
jgi:hypothetical protein